MTHNWLTPATEVSLDWSLPIAAHNKEARMRPEHWLYTIPLRLRSLFRRRKVDEELDEEIRDHLERQAHALVAKGMDPEAARRIALQALGGADQIKERCRDVRRVRLLSELVQDLRYGARMLKKSPGFAAVAVLTLALGVGANSAIFSVIDAVLLRPLPFKDPGRLARVYTTAFGGVLTKVTSRKDFLDWQKENNVFEQMTVYGFDGNTLTGVGEPQRVDSADAGPGFFQLFGVEPVIGRTFSQGEYQPNSRRAVLLGEGFWKKQFGSDRGIVGRSLVIDGNDTTVVGVVPDRFESLVGKVQMWFPLENLDEDRGNRNYWAIGRLKPGAAIKQANTEMAGIAYRLEQLYHESNHGWCARVVSLQDSIVGDVRLMLLILLGAVGLVLLIACANVTNLLLARAARRSQEIAIRSALGAGRGRLIRQLLTEGLLLSVLGGAIALLIGATAVSALAKVNTDYVLPKTGSVRLDAKVVGFTLILSILATLIFGLAPALRLSGRGVGEAMRAVGRGMMGGRHSRRIRSFLVVSELAISLVLLVGCGLLIRSFYRLGEVNPGFDTHGLIKAQVGLDEEPYSKPESRISFYNRLMARLSSLPDGVSAALCTTLPLDGNGYTPWYAIVPEGRPFTPEETIEAQLRQVSPGYFRVMRMPLVEGRDFNALDRAPNPWVTILSESLAHRLWPGQSAVGKRITNASGKPIEVVGVAGDVKLGGLDDGADIAWYLPYAQAPSHFLTIVARGGSRGLDLAAEIKEAVGSIDRTLAVYRIATMDDIRSNTLAARRFNLVLLSIFAGLALLLSAVGTYGVISYSVAERTQEIGVRVALGANRKDVVWLVVGQVGRLAFIASAVGLVGAAALTRIMRSLLFKVSPTDPLVFVLVSLFLIAVSLAAGYLPAKRAASADPLAALRYQ